MKGIKKNLNILILTCFTIFTGCENKENTLFVSLDADQTGILFTTALTTAWLNTDGEGRY